MCGRRDAQPRATELRTRSETSQRGRRKRAAALWHGGRWARAASLSAGNESHCALRECGEKKKVSLGITSRGFMHSCGRGLAESLFGGSKGQQKLRNQARRAELAAAGLARPCISATCSVFAARQRVAGVFFSLLSAGRWDDGAQRSCSEGTVSRNKAIEREDENLSLQKHFQELK